MPTISPDLRRAAVAAYEEHKTDTYEETAAMFGIARATLGRLLKRKRETGDVLAKPRGGNRKRAVDLDWLRANAAEHPDARLVDRIDAWVAAGNRPVSVSVMWGAMNAIEWTHKKNADSPRA